MISYVRVLIWESSLEEKVPSQRYGHVALETCTRSADPTYMSFWACGHPKTCGAVHPHFHNTKEQDDREETGKVARSYCLFSLDVSKINAAFEAFKANPDAWGALGWGIFGRAYARDCRGLTVFLLETGGIFNHPQVEASYKLNSIGKKVFYGFGFLYSAVNLLFSHGVKYYNDPLLLIQEWLLKYISVHSQVLPFLEAAPQFIFTLTNISQEIDASKRTDRGEHQRVFSEHTVRALNRFQKWVADEEKTDVLKLAEGIEESVPEVQEHIARFQKIGYQLKWVSIISAVSLLVFNYINNRFIASRYSPRDIRVLLEKAAK